MSSPSAADGSDDLRSSSSSRREGTRLVVFFGAAATSSRVCIHPTGVYVCNVLGRAGTYLGVGIRDIIRRTILASIYEPQPLDLEM